MPATVLSLIPAKSLAQHLGRIVLQAQGGDSTL
jgi:hypothetical protein